MSALTRSLVVAEMQGRDLLHRRAAMALFVLLPAAFYYAVPADEEYSLLAGFMGVSWAVAAAGLFAVLGWRRVDPRLVLAGAPRHHGLAGRVLLLHGIAFALVVLFAPQLLWRSSALVVDPTALLVGLALMALVSVPLGLAIGVLVPREMEATLVLIGVIGVGMSVPPDATVAQVLPLWGPFEAAQVAAGWKASSALVGAVAHALTSTVLLAAVATAFWYRRVRIAPASPR